MGAKTNFITVLNETLGQPCSDQELATAIEKAALVTLGAAMKGHEIVDGLTRNQAGALLAAVQWNHNPVMKAGVKVAK